MEPNKKLVSAEKLLAVFAFFCMILCLGVFFLMNLRGYSFFNSDAYADTQVAKRIWEQKTLFPEGWTFGNQYYVIATPVLAALLYGVTGNSYTAMVIATELMTLLILLSFWWMLRPVTSSVLSRAFGCLLLMAAPIAPWGPYSIHSMLFYTQASFYSCYLITLFVVFGDYARSLLSGKKRLGTWLLALVLCFATGMQSLRQTVIMVLPILAYELLRFLRSQIKREAAAHPASILRAASYAAANLAGILTVKCLDIPQATIYSERTAMSQRLQTAVNAVLEISSLDYILSGDSSRALALVIAFLCLLVLAAAVLWLLRIHRQESSLEVYWILCVIGIFGVLLATVLLPVALRAIYIFLWFPLVAFSGLLLAERLPRSIRLVFLAAACVLSLASILYCYLPHIGTGEGTDAHQMSQWAVDNGYKYIYGEYWGTAPQIAVYSQDKLEAGCWHTPENIFHPEPSNTPQDIYGEEENKTALYVFTAEDEAAGLAAAQKRGIALEKVAEFGAYRGYIASAQLMGPA